MVYPIYGIAMSPANEYIVIVKSERMKTEHYRQIAKSYRSEKVTILSISLGLIDFCGEMMTPFLWCSRWPRHVAQLGCLLVLFALAPAALATWPAGNADCKTDHKSCPSPQSGITAPAATHIDQWQDANVPRRMLARIQSNLDRVAAGQPVWPVPGDGKPDPLTKIVAAYADFLHGDFRHMDSLLTSIEKSAKIYRPRRPDLGSGTWQKKNASVYRTYTTATRSALPLVRLYAGLRAVDGALFAAAGNPFTGKGEGYILATAPSPLNGTWLRLPCRTVIGRVRRFKAADDTLDALGGPVLDCPVDGPTDYAHDAVLARHPERLRPHHTPLPKPRRVIRPPSPNPAAAALPLPKWAPTPNKRHPFSSITRRSTPRANSTMRCSCTRSSPKRRRAMPPFASCWRKSFPSMADGRRCFRRPGTTAQARHY